jgi:hypothetical protein
MFLAFHYNKIPRRKTSKYIIINTYNLILIIYYDIGLSKKIYH